MGIVERTRSIAASSDEVWAVLSDFAVISKWAPNVDHSCLLSGQAEGVGTARRIQTDQATIVETIETWEPGSTLSYRITGLPPIIKSVTNTWQLEAVGHATRDTLTSEVDAGTRPPQRLIAKAVGKRLAGASEQMLDGLTRHLEAAQSTGAST